MPRVISQFFTTGSEFDLPWWEAVDVSCLRIFQSTAPQRMDRIRLGDNMELVIDHPYGIAREGAKGIMRQRGWRPQKA
jgi:hypothetical protein